MIDAMNMVMEGMIGCTIIIMLGIGIVLLLYSLVAIIKHGWGAF